MYLLSSAPAVPPSTVCCSGMGSARRQSIVDVAARRLTIAHMAAADALGVSMDGEHHSPLSELDEVSEWLRGLSSEMVQHAHIFAHHRLTTMNLIMELTDRVRP